MRKLLFILLLLPAIANAQSIGVIKSDSSLNITNPSGTNTKFKSWSYTLNAINSAIAGGTGSFVTTNTTQTISAAKTFSGTIFTSAVAPITDLSASLGNIGSLRYLNIYVAKVFTNNIQSLTSDISFLNTSSVGTGKIFNSTGNFTWGGTTDAGWRLDIVGNGTNGGIRATNITSTDLTASKAVFTDANKKLTSYDLFGTANNWIVGQQFSGGVVSIGLSVYNASFPTFTTQITPVGVPASNKLVNLKDEAGTLALLTDLGSAIDNVLSKTSDYTIVSGDFAAGKKRTLDLYVDATSSNVTITMPSASTFAGYTIYVTKTDASVNTVTVNTVLGGSTILTQYQSRQFNSNATAWYNH